ncbi:MAG: right-handed parallel beta-helix repeat-containing protein, partial [Planctomycetota bacterium]
EYMGNQDTNSWATANYDPCGLKDGTWYYWRIDEVNGPNTWKGDVWSFETDAPFIELSATQFDFTAYEGGANPDDQILSISNSGGGTLNWEIVEDCNWLTVEPNTGSNTGETDDVNLSVDISGLVGGIHDCSLTISGSNASNSPQGVGVRLVVGIVGELYVPSEYPTIQYAIDVALDGAIVIVAPGTYTGADNKNLDFSGKAITVQSTNPEDPCVVGGTIIDCENSGRGFYFHSGEDANSIVAGLTVKNGEIQGTVSDYDAYGGGIHCSGASPTILKCRILSCRVYGYDCSHCGYAPAGEAYGGGISCISGSHPTIVDCEIRGNLARAPQTIEGWADAYGGGIFCSSDSTVGIYNCRITANTAHGGKWMSGASWISGARDSYGGGIYIGGSIGSNIKNCLITNNQTVLVTGEDYEGTNYGKSEGAGIFCENDVNVVNCTLVGNYTDPTQIRGDGGGIYGPSMVINSIIRGNLSPSQLFGTTSVTYSDIEGGFSGPGNIDSDPCFADPCGGDYHLKSAAGRWDANSKSWVTDAGTSPCIDAGDPNSDWTEELWPHGKQINMGAYGGTAEASMSLSSVGNIANLDNDVNDIVDGIDLGLFVEKWCYEEPLLAEDLDRDGFVNFVDFAIFASECSGVTVGETSISYQIDDCNMGAKAAVESEETRFTTTVVGSYIYFEDMMTANCCPDELFLEMDVDGNVITIYEREVLAMPCLCICDYPVTATLGPFEAGVYTLEVYEDYGGFIGSTIVTIGP